MRLFKKNLFIDNETIVCEYELRAENAVILHGAGQASRTRYYTMAELFLKKGVGVVLLDFSGHGDSTGHIKELSLKRRQIQASVAIDQILPPRSTFYLVGFSMSGQTVCDLLPMYDGRIKAILLGCPGIYTTEAYDLPFGTEEFTHTIRQFESWRASDAPMKLQSFEGKTVLAIGGEDTVIPARVITKFKESAQHVVYHEYDGVDHGLAVWLSDHPEKMENLIDELIQESIE